MPTNMPTALDTFVDPIAGQLLSNGHIPKFSLLHSSLREIEKLLVGLGWKNAVGLGADPTGAVDCTAILQTALNAGQRVILPPCPAGGFYQTSYPLLWPAPSSTAFQPSPWLLGDGSGRSIIRNIGSNRTLTATSITSGSTTLTDTGGAFTSQDRGKVLINGPAGIPAGTYVASINSSTSVEMSDKATATVSAQTVTLGQVVLSVAAPTVSGSGAYTAGTNFDVHVEGIKFEGKPGQIGIYTHRYFKIIGKGLWFSRAPGAAYGFGPCMLDYRIFDLGPPRRDDSNIGLHLEDCLFDWFSVGLDTSLSSAGAHQVLDRCYFQGSTQATMTANPTMLNIGAKMTSDHISGVGTQFVSCDKALWLAFSGDTGSIDRTPTAVELLNWHFEGSKTADLYVEACSGLNAEGCQFIDHNGADPTWVPTMILVPDNGSNTVGNINVHGGYIAPSADATYGTNWRGVHCGSNFDNSGKSYITIDSPYLTQMVGAAAMNDTTAANFSLVVERVGPIVKVNGSQTRGFQLRFPSDSTARLAMRSTGFSFGPGGVTVEDTLLQRTGVSLLAISTLTGTAQTSYVQSTPLSLVNTNFTAIGDAINTVGKFAGRTAYDTTSGKPLWAAGGAAGSVWKDATGATVYTPV